MKLLFMFRERVLSTLCSFLMLATIQLVISHESYAITFNASPPGSGNYTVDWSDEPTLPGPRQWKLRETGDATGTYYFPKTVRSTSFSGRPVGYYRYRVDLCLPASGGEPEDCESISGSVTVTVGDPNDPPLVTITNPSNNSSYQAGTNINFQATATDPDQGNISNSISWSSSFNGNIGTGSSINFSSLSVGTHQITAYAQDNGELSDSDSIQVVINPIPNTPPTLVINSPVNGSSFIQGTAINFTGTATDNEDGNISSSISWNSNINGYLGSGASPTFSNLSAGTHQIRASVQDSGSSPVVSETITITVVNTGPTVTISSPANNSSSSLGASVTFSGTADDPQDGSLTSSLTWSSSRDGNIGSGGSFSTSALTFGTHTISASVTDSLGAPGSDQITFTVGVQGNTISVSPATVNSGQNFTVDWAGASLPGPLYIWRLRQSGSSVGSYDYPNSVSSNTFSRPTGTYTYRLQHCRYDPETEVYENCTDLSGSATVTVLNIDPEVTISSPSNGSTFVEGDQINFVASATDNEENNATLTSSITWSSNRDGSLPLTGGSVNTSTLSVGTHQITASVTDSDGGAGSDSVSITINPNTPPSVTISSPVNGSNFAEGGNISFTGSATDNEDGALTSVINWTRDGGIAIGNGATVNISTLSVGSHVITATVQDSRGAPDTDSISITIDPNTAPTVSIVSPTDNSLIVLGDSVTFNGTAVDPQEGDLSADLTWSSNVDGGIGNGGSFNTSSLSYGAHTITASVQDSLGLPGIRSINLLVDIPTNIISVSPTTVEAGEQYLVSWNGALTPPGLFNRWQIVESHGSNQQAFLYSLDKFSQPFFQNSGGPYSYRLNYCFLSQINELDCFPVNGSATVVVANTEPSVTINSPINGTSFVESSNVPFSGTATDLEDGVISGSLIWTSDIDGEIGSGNSFNLSTLTIGSHQITASVEDDGGLADFETVSISITPNTPPDVSITSPLNGSNYTEGNTINFSAVVTDVEDGIISEETNWSSSIDGFLGEGSSINVNSLSQGVHQITAQVQDSHGDPDSQNISITVNPNTQPVVTILNPNDGAIYTEGDQISFSATGIDAEDGNISNSLSWASSIDGVFGTGPSVNISTLSIGNHQITAAVTDLNGLGDSRNINITVNANTPPVVLITSPTPNTSTVGDTVIFTASATDSEDGDISADLIWTSDRDGAMGSGSSISISTLTIGNHLVTASVQDRHGLPGSTNMTFVVTVPSDVISVSPTTSENGNYTVSWVGAQAPGPFTNWRIVESGAENNFYDVAPNQFTLDFINKSNGTYIYRLDYCRAIPNEPLDCFSIPGNASVTVSPANAPPTITFSSPSEGENFTVGAAISFVGSANDDLDGDISSSISWVSNISGVLGTGNIINTSVLEVGSHRITASITDAGGLSNSDTVNITVSANSNPTVTITAPADGTTFAVGEAITFEATANDVEDDDISSSITWRSNIDGDLGSGSVLNTSALSEGIHQINAIVQDSGGIFGSDLIAINIVSIANSSPTISVSSPAGGSSYLQTDLINFSASAQDVEDGNLGVNIQWSSDLEGLLGFGEVISISGLLVGSHTITAAVTDSSNVTSTESVAITVLDTPISPIEITIQTGDPETSSTGSWNFGSGITMGYEGNTGLYSHSGGSNTYTFAPNIPQAGSYLVEVYNSCYSPRSHNTPHIITHANGVEPQLIEQDCNVDPFVGQWRPLGVYDFNVGNAGNLIISTENADNLFVGATAARFTLQTTSPNNPPAVSIVQPTSGGVFPQGATVVLEANSLDSEDGDISNNIVWSSNIDGALGNGSTLNVNSLSLGSHLITATVTDLGGLSNSDDVTIDVVSGPFINNPPTLSIAAPYDGLIFAFGAEVNLIASANDIEEGNLNSNIVWSSSIDGSLGVGAPLSIGTLSIGDHILTATVQDAFSETANDSINISIIDNSGSSNEIIIQTGDPETSSVGSWYTGSAITQGYQGNTGLYSYSSGNNAYTFRPNIPQSGLYQVEVYNSCYSPRSNSTSHIITHANGVYTQSIEQDCNLDPYVGQWRPLGVFSFNTGTAGDLTISSQGANNQFIGATAARFTSQGASQNAAPIVSIVTPTGLTFTENQNVMLTGLASDVEDGDISSNIQWVSDIDGVIGSGGLINTSSLSIGTHQIVAIVTDSAGISDLETIVLNIQSNSEPVVTINSPDNNGSFFQGEDITFSATATDVEDANLNQFVQWQSNLDGDLGAGSTITSNTLSIGSHQITATVTDSGGKQGSHQINITITLPAGVTPEWAETGGAIPDAPVPAYTVPSGDVGLNSVGVLAGSGGVSGGQASYSIPIQVPPGRKGMQPSVSLNYSSSNGNGVAGVGWSLSAGESISRCGATAAQDGFSTAVQFDANRDRLCFNGQRLVRAAGVYGASGTQYSTEIDTFVRIIQTGDINGPSTYFTVEYRDGTVAQFGTGNNSRQGVDGRSETLVWAIDNKRDRSGNTITYDYTNYGMGEYKLSAIHYTGYQGSDGDRHVRFQYEDRPDRYSSYLAGGRSRNSRRLSQIVTEYQTTVVREYNLNYGTPSLSSNRSLLRSIEECAYKLSEIACLPPTTFEWQESAQQFVTEQLQFSDEDGDTAIVHESERWLHDVLPHGDANGDGVKDFADHFVNAEGEITGTHSNSISNCYKPRLSFNLVCFDPDFNADGLTDSFRRNNNKLEIQLNGSSTWVNTNIDWIYPTGSNDARDDKPLAFADFNGDGWLDLAFKRNSRLHIYFHTQSLVNPYSSTNYQDIFTFTYSGSPSSPVNEAELIGDMDGNGTPDFVVMTHPSIIPHPSPTSFLLVNPQSNGSVNISTRSITGLLPSPRVRGTMFADINGDGLSDILTLDSTGAEDLSLMYRLNNGTDFESGWIDTGFWFPTNIGLFEFVPGEPETLNFPSMSKVLVMDYNGDSRQEILYASQVVADGCHLITGTGFRCNDELYGLAEISPSRNHFSSINSGVLDNSVRRYRAISFNEDSSGDLVPTVFTTGITASASQAAVVDATGDGLPDVVTVFGCRFGNCTYDNSSYVEGAWINRNLGASDGGTRFEAHDMLKSVENGFGARSEWTYRPLSSDEYDTSSSNFYDTVHSYQASDPDYFHFASSMYVVADHRTSNGIGSLNSTKYRYRGAIYNNKGRGFQGFKTIITEIDLFDDFGPDANKDLVSRTDFEQKWPISSIVEQSCTWLQTDSVIDDNPNCTNVLSHSTTDAIHNVATSLSSNGNARFVAPSETTTRTYDLLTRALINTTVSEVSYNAAGFQAYSIQTHTDSEGVTVNESLTAYSSNFELWWLDRIWYKTQWFTPVSTRRVLEAEVVDGTDERKSVTTYFDQYNLTHRTPERTRTIASDSSLISYQDFQYNDYGLPTSAISSGTDFLDRTVTTNYTNDGLNESADGYFPLTVTQASLLPTTTVTDPAHGVPLSQVDPNGLITDITYDAFGRVMDTTPPGVPTAYARYEWCDGVISCPTNAIIRVSTYQQSSPDSHIYMDQFGRTLRSSIRNFADTDFIQTDVVFDLRGNRIFESRPYDLSASESGALGTRYLNYDALGRLTLKEMDQANGSVFTTTYNYLGLQTNIDAGGLTMHRISNYLGQLIETRDAESGYTRYAYDGAGNPIVMQDAEQNIITASFNALGHKNWVNDPDMGVKLFTYNALGEVLSETDANFNTIDTEYDNLGRVERRLVNGQVDGEWFYDNPADNKGLGLLDFEDSGVRADGTRLTKDYVYTSSATGRKVPESINYSIYEGASQHNYSVQTFYDAYYGRVKGIQYSDGLRIATEYTDHGYSLREINPQSQYIYRETTSLDSYGNISSESLTDGLLTQTAAYFRATGQMDYIQVTLGASTNIHALGFEYDIYGNLDYQDINTQSDFSTETFIYDDLHRLQQSNRSINAGPLQSIDYAYSESGNLLQKSDYGTTYYYDGPRPHAVTRVDLANGGLVTFGYDNNGNMTSGHGRNISYNAFNKPLTVSRSGNTSAFSYGADLMRYRHEKTGALNEVTLYLDKLTEIKRRGNTTQTIHYVGDYAVISKSETSGQDAEFDLSYLHKDRLGSTVSVTNEFGFVEETNSFDPFGKPRNGDWSDRANPILNSVFTTRGFTAHEHLDEVGLIHMNGRAYDYELGRFLSVDPFIQSPGNSQSANPYSYIMNNPLAGVDPSGYESKKPEEKVEKEDIKVDDIVGGKVFSNGTAIVETNNGSFFELNNENTTTLTSSLDIQSPAQRDSYQGATSFGEGLVANIEFGVGVMDPVGQMEGFLSKVQEITSRHANNISMLDNMPPSAFSVPTAKRLMYSNMMSELGEAHGQYQCAIDRCSMVSVHPEDYILGGAGIVKGMLGMAARRAVAQSVVTKGGDDVLRVVEPGKPQFQLKQGEQGLSVFDAKMVGADDILPNFRAGSQTVNRSMKEITDCGLTCVRTPGDPSLPKILQDAHMEIRPGPNMTRKQFKKAIKELEPQ